MQMHEYRKKYDSLVHEEELLNIPGRKEFILEGVGRGRRVLDVGCLGGMLSRLILERNNEVWGVELNEAAAKIAASRGVRVKVANVEEGIPFESGFFDVVHAGELIEQLYDTKAFFLEVARVLKPDGVFLFTTPNLNSVENRVKVLAGGYLSMTGAYPEDHFGDHLRFFNIRKLRELCAQTGFQVDEIRGAATFAPKGRLVDKPLSLVAKAAPSLAKFLMVRASKF